jgi:hypothetical protein
MVLNPKNIITVMILALIAIAIANRINPIRRIIRG